ncbi:amidase [Serratia sp. NPDC078593]|uniref:amidase n=1 Tax=unclassified Serratia (in: enterobacteria) TaxID=2647522 RepID=UPI0037D2F53A
MDELLHTLPLTELALRLRDGRLTPGVLTDYFLTRIAHFNPHLHAFIHVDAERARRDAKRAEKELATGQDRGLLHGIPYALKDIFDVAGTATTCHSKIMQHSIAQRSSTVETRLAQSGGIYLGKLATHEFALGGPSFELPFPPARNPWNLAHFTGASSSGAGAAVAAGLTPIAMGSDTSGSIRGPACLCGVVGFKPTYGLVSRAGVFPLSWSLDHCGPLTRYVIDSQCVMQALAGYDKRDPSSHPTPYTFDAPRPHWAAMRIAWPRHLLTENPHTDPELIAAMDHCVTLLREAGASVEEIHFPDFALFNACGRIIMAAEAFAIHQKAIRHRPEAFGRYTYQRILPGATISAAELLDAQRLRAELTGRLNSQLFPHYSLLLFPSTLRSAPHFNEFTPDWPPPGNVVPTQTIPFNVTGNPALNIPIALSSERLPLGMQLVGGLFDDAALLAAGKALERWLAMPALDDMTIHNNIALFQEA